MTTLCSPHLNPRGVRKIKEKTLPTGRENNQNPLSLGEKVMVKLKSIRQRILSNKIAINFVLPLIK